MDRRVRPFSHRPGRRRHRADTSGLSRSGGRHAVCGQRRVAPRDGDSINGGLGRGGVLSGSERGRRERSDAGERGIHRMRERFILFRNIQKTRVPVGSRRSPIWGKIGRLDRPMCSPHGSRAIPAARAIRRKSSWSGDRPVGPIRKAQYGSCGSNSAGWTRITCEFQVNTPGWFPIRVYTLSQYTGADFYLDNVSVHVKGDAAETNVLTNGGFCGGGVPDADRNLMQLDRRI